jgi:hypothetical protein
MRGAVSRRIVGFGLAVGVGLGGSVGLGVLVLPPVGAPKAVAPLSSTHTEPALEVDAGPVVATRMVDRLQLFQTGNAGTRIELDGTELTALLRHTIPGILPPGVSDPVVQIVDSEVRVQARVAPRGLPGGGHLGGVMAVVPDVVEVELRGHLSRPSFGIAEYRVDRAEVEGIPLPSALVGLLVQSWPGGLEAGSAGGIQPVIRVRWPIDGGRFHVADGVLVIVRPEPLLLESVDGSGGA